MRAVGNADAELDEDGNLVVKIYPDAFVGNSILVTGDNQGDLFIDDVRVIVTGSAGDDDESGEGSDEGEGSEDDKGSETEDGAEDGSGDDVGADSSTDKGGEQLAGTGAGALGALGLGGLLAAAGGLLARHY